MLRHRRQQWAAMDFLLASYRKQKKWIQLRQWLLLLARLAVAALLIAMLCGWTGGGKLLGALGGRTTHHVIVLDDSASMGDTSAALGGDSEQTAYRRALRAIDDLTRRLASEDGNHQLTVMRSSRAALVVRGGSDSGDAAADLSAQTVTSDARLINRLMSTEASPIRTDLVPAIDLASELLRSTQADTQYLYIASDFRQRDWGNPDRIAESLRKLAADATQIRMIDCAANPTVNLAITELSPSPDVWVAGVPVVISAKIKNYGDTAVKNISMAGRVVRYPSTLTVPDPTRQFSGEIEMLPAMLIESLAAGEEVTKTFQVFVTEKGTHAIEVSLPEDCLSIDNTRSCTLPLSDVEKVLIIDSDPDQRGFYHLASVLNPGSQVRIGAIPEYQPPTFLRGATLESLSAYRAIYLVDVPTISENAAGTLSEYVRRGGGLAWFVGPSVDRGSYNDVLLKADRALLPSSLGPAEELADSASTSAPDVVFGEDSPLLDPIRSAGDGVFSLVGVTKSWTLLKTETSEDEPVSVDGIAVEGTERQANEAGAPRVREVLRRRDGEPLVTLHESGRGRIVTVLTGLDGTWTNWPGDPTFVVFILQTNATLWSGAAPPTKRFVDETLVKLLPSENFLADVTYLPATNEAPRIPIDFVAQPLKSENESAAPAGESTIAAVTIDPLEMVLDGESSLDELVKPGISEWGLTRVDGRGEVIPVASVIQVGEGDLRRSSSAEVQQALLPIDVQFVSSSAWSEENQTAGSSTLTLVLLGLLGTVLAGEQMLAYWASYHVAPSTRGAR